MTDIVERLENWDTVYEEDADCDGSLYLAARDEILRLRKVLEDIAELQERGVGCGSMARAALRKKEMNGRES